MENIKDSFQKVKKDIFSLGEEISNLRLEIIDIKTDIKLISSFIADLRQKIPEITPKKEDYAKETIDVLAPTDIQNIPTNQHIIPTHPKIPTDNPSSQALKHPNLPISTGNGGVPTDRQTDRQTDRHIIQHIKTTKKQDFDKLDRAKEILDNLDALKKEIRIKIKRLTAKEIQVFSLLYDLENQGEQVDYPLLSSKLQLSESSIRDYIGKIQHKGIPIIKEKLNNKKIILHISLDLKKIASLDTILRLREI